MLALLSLLRVFDTPELFTYDLRCQIRAYLKPPVIDKRIVIVEIGDDTLERIGTWPLQRDYHGSLVDVLSGYGARAIVFDILFSDPKLVEDRVLIEAIKEAGNVYLPIALREDWTKTAMPLESHSIAADLLPGYKQAARGYGYINVMVDPDGKKRRIPLLIKLNNELIPHLAFKVAADVAGFDLSKVRFKKNRIIVDDRFSIPLDGAGFFMVNYPTFWGQAFRHVSYFDVIASYKYTLTGQADKAKLDLASFKDAIFFIGLTATGTHDYHPTPLERIVPMIGLQTSVCNSILTQQFIYDVGPLINTLINLLLLAAIVVLTFKNELWPSLLTAASFAACYFIFASGLFIFAGIWIDLLLPLMVITCGWVGVTVYKFLDQARKRVLLEKELDIARQIQQRFLPREVKSLSNLEIVPFMQPAKFVGGDLYDIVQLGEKKVGIFIGDVSGKGVPAALIMAQAISLLRVFAKTYDDPAQVLQELNRQLSQVLEGRFVTAFYLIFDMHKATLSAACAGHNPLMVYNRQRDRVEEFLPASGLPLGVMEEASFERFERKLQQGDIFLLYTDGATEARDKKGQEFGEERIKSILFTQKRSSGSQIAEILKKTLFKFSKGLPQFDDITFIVLNVREATCL